MPRRKWRARLRKIATIAIPLIVFAALAYPSSRLTLYCIYGVHWIGQKLAVIDERQRIADRVYGSEYFLFPDNVHLLSWFVGCLGGFGPAVLFAFFLYHRSIARRHTTYCGQCGTNIDSAGGFLRLNVLLACPFCKATPAASSHKSPTRFFIARRFAIALVAFTFVSCLGIRFGLLRDTTEQLIIDVGIHLGFKDAYDKARFSDLVGFPLNFVPFEGDTRRIQVLNLLYANAPWAAPAAVAFAISFVVFWMCSNYFARTRLFGYRGPTRCDRCRYSLAGIVAEQCPECGKSF
jgi:hypothetical protein